MIRKNYRAYYKPDRDTADGLMRFDMVTCEDQDLYWVANIDPDIRYPFPIPFMDNDWEVHQFILTTPSGLDIFEHDKILTEMEGVEIRGTIRWNEHFSCFFVKMENGNYIDMKSINWENTEVVGQDITY